MCLAHRTHSILVALSTVQFILATALAVSDLVYQIDGFIALRNVPGAIDLYFIKQDTTEQIIVFTLWVLLVRSTYLHCDYRGANVNVSAV